MSGKVYFASDFHLGIPDHDRSLEREKRLVSWLSMVQRDAAEIFLLGDLFDFWFEYRTAVPRGYTRLLGKLASICDSGIPVHLFRGNHDMWAFNYLEKEIGIRLHREPEFRTFAGRQFYLAHGDGLGPGDHGYKFIKKVFANPFNQWLFRMLHPDFGIRMALFWSRKSRYATVAKEKRHEDLTLERIRKRLTAHSKDVMSKHPGLDYLVYGHYHHPVMERIGERTIQVVLGDWLTHFTYAVFDGEKIELVTWDKTV